MPFFGRRKTASRSALFEALNCYNALHEANVAFFESLNERFYADAVRSSDKSELFWKEFIDRLAAMTRWRYKFGEELSAMAAHASMSWSDQDKEVRIHIDAPDEQIAVLNGHKELRLRLTELLKAWYRYDGKSRFYVSDDIPF